MAKKIWMLLIILVLGVVLAACTEEDPVDETDEIPVLEVDLQVEDTIGVGETLDLKAVVTYGEEDVTDADEVEYEVWEEGQKDDSYRIESTNNEDGTYTAETSFDTDGIFHVQVHVTARDLHTMPKQDVTVGEGGDYPESDEEENMDGHSDHDEDAEEHGHADLEGFGIHFVELESVQIDENIQLAVHLTMDHSALMDAQVRFEIWSDDIPDEHAWVDAEEASDGEYTSSHSFSQEGTYQVQVHVKNDEGLHEHEIFEVNVHN